MNNNGRINNMQRRMLSKLAEETLNSKIQAAKDEEGQLVDEITKQVRHELGVDTITNQIAALEKQVEILEEKKLALGFPKFSHVPIPKGSDAGKLIDSRTHTQSQKLRNLQEKRTEAIAKIWSSVTLDSAMALLDEVRAM